MDGTIFGLLIGMILGWAIWSEKPEGFWYGLLKTGETADVWTGETAEKTEDSP